MQQYLKITNQGLICEEDLILIGSSSKREDNSKIGMFGSGWKYALAWLIRNDCTPFIFAGTDRIDVDYRATVHRNNPVRIITVNGKETSLTAEMGPQWTGWMALREIVSNAIDEGNYDLSTHFNITPEGSEGTTTVIIPMIKELKEVIMRYDNYFAFEREPTVTNSIGSIYLKAEQSEKNIYRKGIRCFDSTEKTSLDYNFENIDINESRLASVSQVQYYQSKIIAGGGMTPEIIAAYCYDNPEENSYVPRLNQNILDCLVALAKKGTQFTTKSIINLVGIIGSGLVVPTEWYSWLATNGYAKSLSELLDGGGNYKITNSRDMTEVQEYMAKFGVTGLRVVTGKFEGWSSVIIDGDIIVVKDSALFEDDRSIAGMILSKLPASVWTSRM